MTKLAMLYGKGRGVPRNHAAAIKWLRKAADTGDGTAMVNLSRIYDEGVGVTPDKDENMDHHDERPQSKPGFATFNKVIHILGRRSEAPKPANNNEPMAEDYFQSAENHMNLAGGARCRHLRQGSCDLSQCP